MRKKYKSILILVTLFILLIIYLFNTDLVIKVIIDYTELFLTKFFPVSFIFLLLSNLLINYNYIQVIQRLFKIKSNYIFVYIISLISGFPSGAYYINELLKKDLINNDDANRMIMFCHFPNPLFVLNSLGYVTNKRVALLVLLSIYISNLLMLIFLNRNNSTSSYKINIPDDFSLELKNSIIKSCKLLINIYGISVFFILILSFIIKSINNTFMYVFINGLFDLTKGVYSVVLINNIFIRTLFIIFFISFGSISIHLQTKSILSDTNIKYKNFIIGRIIGYIISTCIFIILYII